MQFTNTLTVTLDGQPRTAALTAAPESTEPGACWTFSVVLQHAATSRPVVFVFNGGPGVATMWLQLSGLAPWRAAAPDNLESLAGTREPLQFTDASLFDVADLVFIDPPGTGYDAGPAPEPALGATGDAQAVAACISGWLDRAGRLGDDAYLLGESYGTIRAALVASALRDAPLPVRVRGIALLGQCLNAQETSQRPGNATGFVAALPYAAATAWYHGRGAHGGLTLTQVTDRARAFAAGPYAAALSSGTFPDELVAELSGLTGLTPETLAAQRHRVDKEWFRRNLLAETGRWVGLTDGRYALDLADGGGADPADARLDPVFSAALRALHREAFGIPADLAYVPSYAAHERWDYQEADATAAFGGSPLPSPFAVYDYPRHLSRFLSEDPTVGVFIGTGHFDALTTVGSVDQLLSQYGLPTERFTRHEYAAGHMMYSDEASSRALVGHLTDFLAATARA